MSIFDEADEKIKKRKQERQKETYTYTKANKSGTSLFDEADRNINSMRQYRIDTENNYINSLSETDRDAYTRVKESGGIYSSPYLKSGSEGKEKLKYNNADWNALSEEERRHWLDVAEGNLKEEYNKSEWDELNAEQKQYWIDKAEGKTKSKYQSEAYRNMSPYEQQKWITYAKQHMNGTSNQSAASSDDWKVQYAAKILSDNDNISSVFDLEPDGSTLPSTYDLKSEQKWMYLSLPEKIREDINSNVANKYLDRLYSPDEIKMLKAYDASLKNLEKKEANEREEEARIVGSALYGTVVAPAKQMASDVFVSPLAAIATTRSLRNNNGVYDVIDPYETAVQRQAALGQYIGQSINEGLEGNKFAQFAYNTSISTTESAARLAIAKGIGAGLSSVVPAVSAEAATGIAMNALMAPSVVNQTATELIEKGVPASQALNAAVMHGVFECLFETVSFDKLDFFDAKPIVADAKTFAKNLLKAGFVEGSEEVATDIANELYDYLTMYDYSDFKAFKDTYEASLGREVTDKEAWGEYKKEFALKLAQSFAGGAVSGLSMGALTNAQGMRNARAFETKGATVSETDAERMRPVIAELSTHNPNVKNIMDNVQNESAAIQNGAMADIIEQMQDTYLKSIDRAKNATALTNIMDNMNTNLNGLISEEAINKYNAKMVEFGKEGNASYETFVANRNKGNATTFSDLVYGAGNNRISQEIRQATEEYTEAIKGADLANVKSAEELQKKTQEIAERRDVLEKRINLAEDLVTKYAETGVAMDDAKVRQYESVLGLEGIAKIYSDVKLGQSNLPAIKNPGVVRMASIEEVNAKAKNTIGHISTVDHNVLMSNKDYRNAYSIASVLSKMTGQSYAFFKSDRSDKVNNGFYDRNTNTTYIDLNAGYEGVKAAVGETFSHELVHWMRAQNEEAYDKVLMFVKNDLGKAFDDFVAQRMKQLDLDMNVATEEVVAEACQRMLADSEVFKKYAIADYQGAKTLRDKLHQFINRFRRAMRELFKGSLDSKVEQAIKDLEGLQKVFDEALAQVTGAVEISNEATIGMIEDNTKVAEKIVGTELVTKDSVKYSQRMNAELMDRAKKMFNEKGKELGIDYQTFYKAVGLCNQVAQRMRTDLAPYLPADNPGKVEVGNLSYGKSMENALVCIRSIVNNDFTDLVSEELGRPLTVEEQLVASQVLQLINERPECNYCYVATDRRAYRAYFGTYYNNYESVFNTVKADRDTFRKEIKGAENKLKEVNVEKGEKNYGDTPLSQLYAEFLDGRKNTAPQRTRFLKYVKDALANDSMALTRKDLASAKMRDLAIQDANKKWFVEDSVKYAKGASYAKLTSRVIKTNGANYVLDYVSYNGSILKWKQELVDALNSEFGLRMYSFSDYVPAFLLENMQMIVDASLRGLKVLAYTKDCGFAEAFADTGAGINISLFGTLDRKAENDAELSRLRDKYKETNSDADRKAYLSALEKYIVKDGVGGKDGMMGANWDRATALRKSYKNVGTVFVATNDDLVEWALANPEIDVVIPYHLVKTGEEVAAFFNYKNYKAHQADRKAEGWTSKNLKEIPPTVHGNDLATYKQALKDNHLTARFSEFIDNPNYMKLVNETRMSYKDMQAVQPNFDTSIIMRELGRIKQEGEYGTIPGFATKADQDAFIRNQNLVGQAVDAINEFDETGKKPIDDGIRNSLRVVDPVVPTTNEWQSGHSEDWFRENGYPIYEDVDAGKKEAQHKTANKSTESTYRKVFEYLKKTNANWKDLRILDASSGLGLGTVAGREMGFNVTDIEPFHSNDYHPMYEDYSELEGKIASGEVEPFDFIISNAVLNVLPQDTRDNMAAALYNLVKPGGTIFINTLGKDYHPSTAVVTQEGNDEIGSEMFVLSRNTVQKGFGKDELKAYLRDAMSKDLKFDNVPGGIGITSLLATKNEANADSGIRNSVRTLSDGTQYVYLDGNIFTRKDGTEMSPTEAYETLVGKKLKLPDGSVVRFVRKLANNLKLYDELFKRRPGRYDPDIDIDTLNSEVNKDIVELYKYSEIEPDQKGFPDDGMHKKNGIESWDTRVISIADDNNAYKLRLAVANLFDGRKIAYAKRELRKDNDLLAKIKKEASIGQSEFKQPSKEKIPQSSSDVNTRNSMRDSQGRELTAEQQEYFADSKVRDENGNLMVVYHGSQTYPFTVFNPSKNKSGFGSYKFAGNNVNYFTTDKGSAESYQNLSWEKPKGNLYEGYANVVKPFTVDAEGGNPFGIKSNEIGELEDALLEKVKDNLPAYNEDKANKLLSYLGMYVKENGGYYEIREFGSNSVYGSESYLGDGDDIREAFDNVIENNEGNYHTDDRYFSTDRIVQTILGANDLLGYDYDGVIVKNVYDTASYMNARTGTDVVTFNSNQFKSIGNTAPTTNDDIRYASRDISSINTDYMKAVEKGDMENAQKYVDEYAKAAGYALKFMHGTNAFGFTSIEYDESDDGVSFFGTDNEEVAATYIRPMENEEDTPHTYVRQIGKKRSKVLSASSSMTELLSALEKEAGISGYRVATQKDIDDLVNKYVLMTKNYAKMLLQYSIDNNIESAAKRIVEANTADDILNAAEALKEVYDIYYNGEYFSQASAALTSLKDMVENLRDKVQIVPENTAIYDSMNLWRTKSDIFDEYLDNTGLGSRGIYELYGTRNKALVIDCRGSQWNSIPVPVMPKGLREEVGEYAKTRDISKWANENGYGVVIFNDVKDTGQYGSRFTPPSTVYAFTRNGNESIKSADPVAYDDNGNVIPLDERFNNNVNDLRFSVRDMANSESEILVNALKNNEALAEGVTKQSVQAYAKAYNELKDMERQSIQYDNDLKNASPSEREAILRKIVRLDRAILKKTTELTEMRNQRVIRDVLIAEWNRRVEDVEWTNELTYQRTREALAKKYGAEISALKTKSTAQKQAIRDRYEINKRKQNIIKKTKALMDMILHGTEKKHIPSILVNPIVEMLDAIDYWTPAENRSVTKKSESMRERFLNFREAVNKYQQQIDEGSELIEYMFDPEFLETVDELVESVKGIENVNDMSVEDIVKLDQTLTELNHLISRGNKMITASHYASLTDAVDATKRTMDARNTLSENTSAKGKILTRLNAGMADSYAFGEYAGEGTREIIDMLSKSFEHKISQVKEAVEFTQETLKPYKKDLKHWSKDKYDFTLSTTDREGNPNKIKMTIGQMMELYLLSKREQARGHIFGGGIRVEDRKGKYTESVKITEEDVGNIIETLKEIAPGAIEVADKLQKYGATTITGWGNEASNLLYGITKFNDENYWQIRSDSAALKDTENTEKSLNASMYRIQNLGRTKATKKGANNAIYIGDVFDTWSKTIDEMTSYASILPATTDAMRWWNSRVSLDEDTNVRIKKLLESKLGTDMTKVFTETIKALNGGIQGSDSLESLVKTLTGKAKAAAVAGNIRVVLQQPTAYTRAAAVIEPKYLLKALTMKPNAKEAQEHSPIAWHKAQGFYSNGLAPSLRKLVIGDGSFGENLTEKSLWLAGKADDITWGALWNASKLKVEAENKALQPGSEAYWNEVNKVFSDIINQTQVVDTPLTKSTWMRGNGLGVFFTAFMAEPTKTYSMVMERFDKVLQNPKSAAAWKGFAGVATVFAVNAMVNAMAQAIADAARDDDKEKDYFEKYKEKYEEDVKDNLNPLTYIPVVKDILSMYKGYNNNNLAMQAAQNSVYAVQEIQKISQGKSKKTLFGQAETIAKAISSWTGIPVGNVMRTLNSMGNVMGIDLFRRKKYTNKELARNIVLSVQEGNIEDADKYMSDLLASVGNEKATTYITDYLANNSEQIDYWAQRYMDDPTVLDEAAEAMPYFSTEAVTKAIRKSVNADATSDDEKIKTSTIGNTEYTSDDINRMLEKGNINKAQEIINEVNDGYAEAGSNATAKSVITSYWKPKYLAASGKEKDEILKMLYKLKNNGKQMYSAKDIAKWK